MLGILYLRIDNIFDQGDGKELPHYLLQGEYLLQLLQSLLLICLLLLEETFWRNFLHIIYIINIIYYCNDYVVAIYVKSRHVSICGKYYDNIIKYQ